MLALRSLAYRHLLARSLVLDGLTAVFASSACLFAFGSLTNFLSDRYPIGTSGLPWYDHASHTITGQRVLIDAFIFAMTCGFSWTGYQVASFFPPIERRSNPWITGLAVLATMVAMTSVGVVFRNEFDLSTAIDSFCTLGFMAVPVAFRLTGAMPYGFCAMKPVTTRPEPQV